jgi:hypothetical protein
VKDLSAKNIAIKRVIRHELPKITITTDASMRGWGAVLGAISIGGRWSSEEQNNHINTLEMMAIFLALKSFTTKISNNYINSSLMLDVIFIGAS